MDGGQFFGDAMRRRLRDIIFRKGKQTKVFEYWCQDCKQLRLSYADITTCGNCGSSKIIISDINTLERSKLHELERED